MQAQELKHPQPQERLKEMEWPDSVTRASRAATPATPRIIFCNPEKMLKLARAGMAWHEEMLGQQKIDLTDNQPTLLRRIKSNKSRLLLHRPSPQRVTLNMQGRKWGT
jgi:hypothetical protein